MPAVRRNHREEARAAVERHGADGPVGRDREPPMCGHAEVWSLGPGHPLVCQLCHPRPGTSPPRPPRPEPAPFITARLSPSPWRDDYRDPPSSATGS